MTIEDIKQKIDWCNEKINQYENDLDLLLFWTNAKIGFIGKLR